MCQPPVPSFGPARTPKSVADVEGVRWRRHGRCPPPAGRRRGRRREGGRAALHVQVGERTRACDARCSRVTLEHVTRRRRRDRVVARVRDPRVAPRCPGRRRSRSGTGSASRRGRAVDPVPGDGRRVGRIPLCVTKTRPAAVAAQIVPWSRCRGRSRRSPRPARSAAVDRARSGHPARWCTTVWSAYRAKARRRTGRRAAGSRRSRPGAAGDELGAVRLVAGDVRGLVLRDVAGVPGAERPACARRARPRVDRVRARRPGSGRRSAASRTPTASPLFTIGAGGDDPLARGRRSGSSSR